MKSTVTTSLIISTYNWPEALRLCLLSICRQTVLPNEVIIADDGSGRETMELIETFQSSFPVPLIHVWQEDEGFRLAKIRNKAIARASGAYIIQIDGDLVLHRHFVKDHLEIAKPNAFVFGSRVLMQPQLSQKMLEAHSISIHINTSGLSNHLNRLRLRSLRKLMADSYSVENVMQVRGCNMAFWHQDLAKVNGYDEAFEGWGREDNEIVARLLNAGIKKRALKLGGVAYHLYHEEKSRADCSANDQRLAATISNKLKRCARGVDQYLGTELESK